MTGIHLYIYSEIQRFLLLICLNMETEWNFTHVKMWVCVHVILHASMKKPAITATLLILPILKFDEFFIISNIIIIVLSFANSVIFLIFVSLKYFSEIYNSFKGENGIILNIKTASKVHVKLVYSQVNNFCNFSFHVSRVFLFHMIISFLDSESQIWTMIIKKK